VGGDLLLRGRPTDTRILVSRGASAGAYGEPFCLPSAHKCQNCGLSPGQGLERQLWPRRRGAEKAGSDGARPKCARRSSVQTETSRAQQARGRLSALARIV